MRVRLVRYSGNPILKPRPDYSWEAGSVINPGAVDVLGSIHLLYRATPTTLYGRPGAYSSSIGLAVSNDGYLFETQARPLIFPTEDYETGLGCEDARISRIGEKYFIFYNAVQKLSDGNLQVGVALATTVNFRRVTKHGVILSSQSHSIRIKAAAPFELASGKIGLAFTLAPESPISSIMYLEFPNAEALTRPVPSETIGRLLTHYDDHVILAPTTPIERGPELGAAPLKTDAGWLLIISPSNHTRTRRWQIGALLLDPDNPRRVIGYISNLLSPFTKDERPGLVNEVAYPCGAIIRDDKLMVYYGAGDTVCNLATVNLQLLLAGLKASPLPKRNWPY